MNYARGQGQADYEERVDFVKIREERGRKSIEMMKQYGLDALLVW